LIYFLLSVENLTGIPRLKQFPQLFAQSVENWLCFLLMWQNLLYLLGEIYVDKLSYKSKYVSNPIFNRMAIKFAKIKLKVTNSER